MRSAPPAARSDERPRAAKTARGRMNGEAGGAPAAPEVRAYFASCLKKSFPLSSTRMNAGKSTTSIL